jgi:hypothetical protein
MVTLQTVVNVTLSFFFFPLPASKNSLLETLTDAIILTYFMQILALLMEL